MRKLALLAFFMFIMLSRHALCETITLYVAENGNDSNIGSELEPLRTIIEASRRIINEPSADATIWLRGGTYVLDQTLTVQSRKIDRLAIKAYPNEAPIITSATRIGGWEPVSRNGQLVWKADYAAPSLRVVYRDSGALSNARYPKTGTLRVAAQAVQTNSLFSKQQSFYADPSQLPESLIGAVVRMPHYWRDELSGVKKYNAKNGLITMNRKSSLTIFQDDPFWFENVLAYPLNEGEWAFDASEQSVYYLPLPGETIDQTVLLAGGSQLFVFDGISNLSIEGVTFEKTGFEIPHQDEHADFPQAAYDAEAAILIRNGHNITFERCSFQHIGAGCIRFETNVQDVAIRDCSFSEIGGQAIYIRGKNSRTDTTRRFTIENNTIAGYGRHFLNAPAILLIHASDAAIRNNTIHDGTYTSISVGWVWGTDFNITDNIQIENNLIFDIGHGILDDMGAIYTLGVQKHTVVSGNIIHDVRARNYGGWGIYLDEGASGILVENNIVYNCSSQGFHQHNGVKNTVRNNIFAYNQAGQIGASDKKGGGTFILSQNILLGEEPFYYRKYGVERMTDQDNALIISNQQPSNLPEAFFEIMRCPQAEAIGFTPFVQAGQNVE